MSKVSLKLSKTSISENYLEEEEQMETEKIKYENRIIKPLQVSKFNINNNDNSSQSFLLPNEIIINVVVKDNYENILLKKIILQIDEKDKLNNILNESIVQFNRLFEYERISVKFSMSDLTLYNLKPSKKNGLPNYDMPGKHNHL